MVDVDLDNLTQLQSVDRSDMLGDVEQFPEQCRRAAALATAVDLKVGEGPFDLVAVLGMGGSGISGDVTRVLVDEHLRLPVYVNRHYDLPAFVGERALVFAVSYSGNTEETLSGANQALDRGATVIGIASGGNLAELCRRRDLTFIEIPKGVQPRAALGYLSIPILITLVRLGLVPGFDAALSEALELLEAGSERYGRRPAAAINPAKDLAKRLSGHLPIIYGSEGITGLAACRWKCQFNENAKSPAGYNQLPELDHNEITGWQQLTELSRRFRLIILRDHGEHPQVAKRFTVTRELIEPYFSGVDEFRSQGQSKLARLLSLVQLGDFASVYLAILSGIDPTPVERIESLKARLRDIPGCPEVMEKIDFIRENVTEAYQYIFGHCPEPPTLAIVLGSGLSAAAMSLESQQVLPYANIPHFPETEVKGHPGQLSVCRIGRKTLLVLEGRFHYYEGYTMQGVAFPVRVLARLGVRDLILTNAAGAINRRYHVGDFVLIEDHLNFMGGNPLIGPNDEQMGPRFVDLREAYDRELLGVAEREAGKLRLPLHRGVLAAVSGPTYETPAESRWLALAGADMVSMSLVPEVIAARHSGLRCLGISCITNRAIGDEHLSHEAVLAVAAKAAGSLGQWLREIVLSL